jgi:two-component system, NarL family, sensor histidine kinase BarA
VEFAIEGADAIKKFKEQAFDVVLMDIQMPMIDGREAFLGIRRWERTLGRASVPVIAITADDRASERASLLNQGFSAVLTKPLRKADLISRLRVLRDHGRPLPPSKDPGVFANA